MLRAQLMPAGQTVLFLKTWSEPLPSGRMAQRDSPLPKPLSTYSHRVYMTRPSFITEGAISLMGPCDIRRMFLPSASILYSVVTVPGAQKTVCADRVETNINLPSGRYIGSISSKPRTLYCFAFSLIAHAVGSPSEDVS